MENDGGEILVLSRGEVVQPLVDTLVIHLGEEVLDTDTNIDKMTVPGNTSVQGWSGMAGS